MIQMNKNKLSSLPLLYFTPLTSLTKKLTFFVTFDPSGIASAILRHAEGWVYSYYGCKCTFAYN